MNSPGKKLIPATNARNEKSIPLAQQRERLLQQIRTHRQVLDYQLGPEPNPERAYPRSMIMRFLTQHPALATAVLGRMGSLAFGARFFKSAGTAMAVVSAMKSVLNNRREG